MVVESLEILRESRALWQAFGYNMCTTYKRKEKEEEGNKENPWINSGVVRSIDINMCKIIKDTVR